MDTYPTLGSSENHLQNPIFGGYVSSLEGNHGVPKPKRIKIAKGPKKIGFDESVKFCWEKQHKKKDGSIGGFQIGC